MMSDAILKMRPNEILIAKTVGTIRNNIRVEHGSKDTPTYSQARQAGKLPFDSEKAHQLGALVECAIARWLTVSWNLQAYEMCDQPRYAAANISDVGDCVEVKATHGWHTVSISKKDLGRKQTLWVGRPNKDFSTVAILGFQEDLDAAYHHPSATPGHAGAKLFPLECLNDFYPSWYGAARLQLIPSQREAEDRTTWVPRDGLVSYATREEALAYGAA